jgi:single-stranded DNA-binding protein
MSLRAWVSRRKRRGSPVEGIGRHERICAYPGNKIEERFDKDGKPYTVMNVVCEGFGTREFYTVFAFGKLGHFALRNRDAKTRWFFEGEVSTRSYVAKDGQQRFARSMKAKKIEIPARGGAPAVECEADATPSSPASGRDDSDEAIRSRTVEAIGARRFRWQQDEFLANHPECMGWKQEMEALRLELGGSNP